MKKLLFIFIFCFCSFSYSQVGINTTNPDNSSMLDVSSTNKGVLIPRVALTSYNDIITIPTPATSLLIYNTATVGVAPNNLTPGFYYYNGTSWVRVDSSESIKYVGPVSGSSNVNAASITGNFLNLAPADESNSGVVTPENQTFSGTKTLTNDAIINGVTVGKGRNSLGTNTATGVSALAAVTTGVNNTAFGSTALTSNTTGTNNCAFGYNTLTNTTSGLQNSAFGTNSLSANTSGSYNLALGQSSLVANTTGLGNTAIGRFSLNTNTTGYYNTSIGYGSGNLNTTMDNNTFIGANADVTANTITNSTAIGANAKVSASNTIRLGNTSILNVNTAGTITAGLVTYPSTHGASGYVLTTTGSGALTWSTNGTSLTMTNINATSNANGATISGGNLSLTPASTTNGGVVTSSAQTFGGNKTFNTDILINNTSAVSTEAGAPAINPITVGKGNIGLNSNTAVGAESLKSIATGGDNNTGTGFRTLYANTSGNENSAFGSQALKLNTTGYKNTSIGAISSVSNTSGHSNTAVGDLTMFTNTTGNENTSMGLTALFLNVSSNNNVAVGKSSLYSSTAGNNTAIGWSAGYNNTTGTNNTYIGYDTQPIGATIGSITNSTAIGNGATISASNTVRVGNTAVTAIGGSVGWTTTSDARLKSNIRNSKYGLKTVLSLRPVEYTLNGNKLDQVGFIAQEVKKLIPEVVTGKEGDISKGETLGITYENIVPVLTKAIQEQQQQIESLKKEIDQLKRNQK